MITAKEAQRKILENPTFERKLELYNEVSAIIDSAVAAGKKQFFVTEEQHIVLNKEILAKGYTEPPFRIMVSIVGQIGTTHPYAYNF